MISEEQKKVYQRIGYVLLITAIIISLTMLINTISQIDNFDNEKLNGKYSGSLLPEDQPIFVLNATFDGKGNSIGNIKLNGYVEEFSSSYVVGGNQFSMSLVMNDTISFQLVGEIINDGLEIQGSLQMLTSETIINGTFSLLKI